MQPPADEQVGGSIPGRAFFSNRRHTSLQAAALPFECGLFWLNVSSPVHEAKPASKKKSNLGVSVCLPACLTDCLTDSLPDLLTDWLTISLSSRCTAEGNRIWRTFKKSCIGRSQRVQRQNKSCVVSWRF